MQQRPRDPSLDDLVFLDGQVFVVAADGGHWVKFVVRRVPTSREKPHGLDYSLTLHAADGERLVGSTTPTRWRGGADLFPTITGTA